MTEPYTPSTTEVRNEYSWSVDSGMHSSRLDAQFDRWLAAHDAEVLASRPVVAEGDTETQPVEILRKCVEQITALRDEWDAAEKMRPLDQDASAILEELDNLLLYQPSAGAPIPVLEAALAAPTPVVEGDTEKLIRMVTADLTERGFFAWLMASGDSALWKSTTPEAQIAKTVVGMVLARQSGADS